VDDHDGATAIPKLAQHLDDRPLGRGVDARERLVHEVELRVLREGPGQKDPLLLAARQLADLPIREVAESDAIEAGQPALAMAPADGAEPADLAVEPHARDVEGGDREVPVDRLTLRHVPDAGASLGERLAPELDLAARLGHQSEARLDEGALARAVGTDDRDESRVGRGVVVDVPEHRATVVGDGHRVDRERARRRVFGTPGEPGTGRGGGWGGHASEAPRASAIVRALWRIMPR